MNDNNRNLILAIAISIFIMIGWQYFYERPRLALAVSTQQESSKQKITPSKTHNISPNIVLDRNECILSSKRVKISSNRLRGSISLLGARFDDITLNDYKETTNEYSDNAVLFSPSNTKESYFAEIGWSSGALNTKLPSSDTIWSADRQDLKPGEELNLSWTNEDNVKFIINVTLDEDYMFTIKQSVINNSNKIISISPYGLINRNYVEHQKAVQILHQGPIGSFNGRLEDITFDDVKEKRNIPINSNQIDWIGISDKYWLSAFIPDQQLTYKPSFSHSNKNASNRYQVDFIGNANIVEPGASLVVTSRLFTGAKKVDLLDKYESQYNIRLFDRAIDFGMFYIITKPLFNILNFFYKYCGNFGISILIVTVFVKALMFGVASKSYRSMKKMKELQPEVDRLKGLYESDKVKLNQEIMAMYKRHNVNPVAGCLPLLIQIPVFFSLYKVLYVTIEMRHAPFFGWIRDLSAPDPTTIFNLFGLLPFTPPSLLMIGIWPILMAGTMYLQQKMSPPPADETQAQVMKFMPIMFLFMFSSFPAGLLIYWTWNNILSIIQQYYINQQSK